MVKKFDVCIRGAGIVGSTLALHLAGKQLRVALVADETPIANDVRAYALNQLSRELLESVRCWPDLDHATAVLSMQVQTADGGYVAFSAAEQGAQALNWIVDVPILEARLREAVRFQPQIEVVEAPEDATLTIVCEGRASRTRAEFGVDWEVTPYGQSALATRIGCSKAHEQVALQWFDEGEILAFLPLDGPQGSQCAVVWSVSPARAQELQSAPDAEFCRYLETASHGRMGSITLAGARGVWPLQQAQAKRWIGASDRGSWVLAGDAAHNMHPLAGQGLNVGLADVKELVRVLTTKASWRALDDQRLLRQYERARKAEFALMGQANDALQQLFTQDHPGLRVLRKWGMNQFERSGSIKHWVASRAMGAPSNQPPHQKVSS